MHRDFVCLFAPPWPRPPACMELRGQGSDPSHSHDLSHNCGNAGSITHCVGAPTSQHFRDAAKATEPQQELQGGRSGMD